MFQPAILIPCLILVAFVAFWVWNWLRFESQPIRKQAKAILESFGQLKVAIDDYPKTKKNLSSDYETQINEVRDKVLNGMLTGEPLTRLDQYPGIGPVTVEKLKMAGYRTIPSLLKANLENISGFGPKRAGDVRNALEAIRREISSRLDSGATPEAKKILPIQEKLRKELKDKIAECEFQYEWRKKTVKSMEELVGKAQEVALVPWLFGKKMPRDLTDPPNITPPSFVSRPTETPNPLPSEVTSPEPQPFPPKPLSETSKSDKPATKEKAYRTEATVLNERPPADLEGPPVTPWVSGDEMEIVARLGMAVGMADGRFSESEKLVIRRFLNELYGSDSNRKNRIATICSDCLAVDVGLDQILNAAETRLPRSLWPKVNSWVNQIVETGRKRGQKEVLVAEKIRSRLSTVIPKQTTIPSGSGGAGNVGTSVDSVVTGSKAEGADSGPESPRTEPSLPENPRKVLEILDSVPLNAKVIRTQWKSLREKYDPAKFSGHGEDFVAMAKNKRQMIDEAAKTLFKEIGEEPTLEEPVRDLRHNPDLDAAFGL